MNCEPNLLVPIVLVVIGTFLLVLGDWFVAEVARVNSQGNSFRQAYARTLRPVVGPMLGATFVVWGSIQAAVRIGACSVDMQISPLPVTLIVAAGVVLATAIWVALRGRRRVAVLENHSPSPTEDHSTVADLLQAPVFDHIQWRARRLVILQVAALGVVVVVLLATSSSLAW